MKLPIRIVFSLVFFCILCIGNDVLRAAETLNSKKPTLLSVASESPSGWPDRSPDCNVWKGFRAPPSGYGNVAFFWWLGDPLTKERLSWQLERMRGMSFSGLQINYAHSDTGGQLYGYTYASDPPLFSEEWWTLYGWFMQESKKQGIAISLSDYTLGISQGWKWDEAIAAYPEIMGSVLECRTLDFRAGETIEHPLPPETLCVGVMIGNEYRSLADNITADNLRWAVPENIGANTNGSGKIYIIYRVRKTPSIDPMHPKSGNAVIENFFQPFEDRHPGETGKGLNFFFSDELDFRVGGRLWNDFFAKEFQRKKGYDIRPELAAIFADIGPRTVKIRLDYYDTLVTMSEENYFRPIYEWFRERGMTYGCDHGGRGRDVTEFGDYFRTQRWNQGPGSDQPGLGKDVVKAKVASSISHLYERPRVWLEGYYGSGWGTSTEQLTDATWSNFLMGYNLLSLHGLYYSTHGGWWEWAPPCNHWRMPYWKHMQLYTSAAERMSYILSQGTHVADVAVLYPVAAAESGVAGDAVPTAFSLCETLYRNRIDMDFIDYESIDRAVIRDGKMCVSGEEYRVIVLPAMRAIRYQTLEKAIEFQLAGGIVLAVGAMPEYSDRIGENDPEVRRLVDLIPVKNRLNDAAAVVAELRKRIVLDLEITGSDDQNAFFMHRRIHGGDMYALYGISHGAEVVLRAGGNVALWDVWSGEPVSAEAAKVSNRTTAADLAAGRTRLRLDATPESLYLVFIYGDLKTDDEMTESDAIGNIVENTARDSEMLTVLDGEWECEFLPTMDNRYGDFQWPSVPGDDGLIGPQARRFRWMRESAEMAVNAGRDDVVPAPAAIGFDDSAWKKYTYAFGPKFRLLGPVPATGETAMKSESLDAFESQLADADMLPEGDVSIDGMNRTWTDFDFSWRFGVEGDPGHQGYHGLKERMYDSFIRLGTFEQSGHLNTIRRPESEGTRYWLRSTLTVDEDIDAVILRDGLVPAAVWVDGKRIDPNAATVRLRQGTSVVLLRYDRPGIGYWIVVRPDSAFATESGGTLAGIGGAIAPQAGWIWTTPGENTGTIRCRRNFELETLPDDAMLCVTADDAYTAFVNGVEVSQGNQWNRVAVIPIGSLLSARDSGDGKGTAGRNCVAIEAVNGGGACGVLAETRLVRAKPGGGVSVERIETDRTWRVTDATASDTAWTQCGFDDSGWREAVEISPYEESLWATHPMGPPEIVMAGRDGAIEHETVGTLAMRWSRQDDPTAGLADGVIPFDPYGNEPGAEWLRFRAPPGTTAILVPSEPGTLTACWIAEERCDAIRYDPETRRNVVTLSETARAVTARESVVALRIVADRIGFHAGELLARPVSFVTERGFATIGDWTRQESLEFYSGGVRYRKTFEFAAPDTDGAVKTTPTAWKSVELVADRIVASAEVRVNGQTAGVRVAGPWRWEISELLRPGENTIEIDVYNTLSNHYRTIPTRYPGPQEAGIIDEITIRAVR